MLKNWNRVRALFTCTCLIINLFGHAAVDSSGAGEPIITQEPSPGI